MPAAASTSTSEPHTMRCLEVWGGNQAIDNGVVMAGLDAWLYSRPFEGHAAGGDIHYVSSCAAGMVTRVLVADVAGHGQKVADAAHRLRSLMRRYVNFIDQTRFVEGLNTEFSDLAQPGGFATAVAATYVGPTDEFTVCNAGHPRPLWFRKRTNTWTVMSDASSEKPAAPSDRLTNIPLGIQAPTRYDQFTVKLETGDWVVIYTDSLTEARGPDGKLLGEQGLLDIVRQLDVVNADELARELLNAIERNGQVSSDDVTILILRPNGLLPRMSFSIMVVMVLRMIRAFFTSLRRGEPEFPAFESGPFAYLGKLSNRIRQRRGI